MLLDKEAKNGMKAVHQAAKKDNKAALKLLLNQDNQLVNAKAPVSDNAKVFLYTYIML